MLVVIAIIAILAGMLLPALSKAKAKGTHAVCYNALRQVGLGTTMYASDNRDFFHHVDGAAPNNGRWTLNPQTEKLLHPNDDLAYWGLAYISYFGGTKKTFRCPSAKNVDEWRENGLTFPAEFWLNSSYGINTFVVTDYRVYLDSGRNTKRPIKLHGHASPQTTVFAQDAAEQRMDGEEDTLGLWPGQSENLTQWKYGLASLYPGKKMEFEWFRHNRACDTLWATGNVSPIKYTKGCDYRWYTGEVPIESPKF